MIESKNMIHRLLFPTLLTLCLFSGCDKNYLIETGKPYDEVQESIRQLFVRKYLPYAELLELQKKGNLLTPEETRKMLQLQKISPVSEIIHSFPKGPHYTFIERTNLNDDEYTSVRLDLYNIDGLCSMEIKVAAVKKTDGVSFADTPPISEAELRKLLDIPEEVKEE
jgi:hypothetical protein